jgi:hypothetical protein
VLASEKSLTSTLTHLVQESHPMVFTIKRYERTQRWWWVRWRCTQKSAVVGVEIGERLMRSEHHVSRGFTHRPLGDCGRGRRLRWVRVSHVLVNLNPGEGGGAGGAGAADSVVRWFHKAG